MMPHRQSAKWQTQTVCPNTEVLSTPSMNRADNPIEGAATTEGTNISASDQIQNMGSGSADHLGLGYRK